MERYFKIIKNVFFLFSMINILIGCIDPPEETIEKYIETINDTEISIKTFENKKHPPRIELIIKKEKLIERRILEVPAKIDEVLKIYYGRDNYLRTQLSIVYFNYVAGYFFVSFTKTGDYWTKSTKYVGSFIGSNEKYQIKNVVFKKSKIFLIEFKDSLITPRMYAEINNRVERVDCKSSIYKD